MINLRKTLPITTSQHGFILPFVLFIIAFSLIVVSASVHLYKSEIHITQNQTEQLKIETLIQIAHAKFKEDVIKKPESNDTISYELPYGDVLVEYAKYNEQAYQLNFVIQTDTGAVHNINKRITFELE